MKEGTYTSRECARVNDPWRAGAAVATDDVTAYTTDGISEDKYNGWNMGG
jgi:hypothetical protein